MHPDDTLPAPDAVVCTKSDGRYQVTLTYSTLAAAQRAHWIIANQTRGTVLPFPARGRPSPDQPGAA